MEEFDQKEFNNFIEQNNVYGFFDTAIILKSGRKPHFYANWRTVIEDAWLTDKLTEYIIHFIKTKRIEVDTFYGVPEGATKLGILTQYKWAIQNNFSKGSHSLSMGRAKPKEHGAPKDKFFVGIPKGKVVIIEDVTTTGESLINTIESLKELNITISAVISLTNRMEKRDDGKSVKEAIESKEIKFYSMSSALEILPIVYRNLKPEEKIKKEIEQEFEKYGVEKINLDNLEIIDKLLEKIDEKESPCVVGLDPIIEKIPKELIKGDSIRDVAEAFIKFNFKIIDAVHDLVPAVKPQLAFYEKYGVEGFRAFKETVDYAKSKGLIVIGDGKRNDISSTAEAYAEGYLGKVKTKDSKLNSIDVDFLTVTPYLGTDGLNPFFNVCKENNKGIFILVKTSNPSSGELQDRLVNITNEEEKELSNLGLNTSDDKMEIYNLVALQVNKYAQNSKGKRGYSPIGAVIGATYPKQAKILRKIMPNSIFLVPGYGAQGGNSKDIVDCFNSDGYGAIVNSSRGIIFAYEKYNKPEKFAEHARDATKEMILDIKLALKESKKYPSNWN